MSLTREHLERWLVVLADGEAVLTDYLASPEGQADTNLPILARIQTGLAEGSKLIRLVSARRRVGELLTAKAALEAEIAAILAALPPP